jgi:hypothetical protein
MLASIQKIIDIKPIEAADAVELAFVLGWQVVVKKGEFKVGDLCVYVQIDTVVPDKPEFEFLRSRNFRVRTIKLRKQLSQGIIFPLSILPAKSVNPNLGYKLEGKDVTEVLEIKKYEKPDNNPFQETERKPKSGYKKWIYLFKHNILYKLSPSLRPKLRSKFPTDLVSITDEERIQNIPHVLETHKGKDFVVSYKLDGSSITIIHNKFLLKHRFRICSRRFELHDKNNDWYKVFKSTKFDKHIIKLVKEFKTNDIIVQGEAIGKFNGNHHGLTHNEIRLFNIYVDGKRLNQEDFYGTCSKLEIPCCPFYNIVILDHTMEEILKISDLPDKLSPKVPAEGLVWRCIEDNTSFKVINNNYLLTEK